MAVQESIKNINETIGNINETASAAGVTSNIKPIGEVLNRESLSAQPDIDLSAANAPVSTPGADRFQEESATNAKFRQDQSKKQAEQTPDPLVDEVAQQKEQTQTATETSFDDYINTVLNSPTFSELQAQEYQKRGVDKKQLQVDQLDTQLLAEQDALRTKIERIQREGGGLKSGAQAEIANLERESLAKQADLALLQLSAQDQLDYATRVADRAVNAMFERQEKVEEVRKEVYETNKEYFDQAEQREFELAFADRERKLEQEKDAAKLLMDTKIETLRMLNVNNAPEALINAAMAGETAEEVISAAGQYGSVDILQRKIQNQQLSNALKQGRKADYEIAQLAAAEERRENAIENGDLLPEQFEVVNEFDDDFRKEPVVKEFNEAAARRFGFEEVVNNGVNGVQDLILVYDFMKSVDPTSVVRESEFDNAAKSGNIFAGQFAKFNQGYFGEGGQLPAEVKKSFLNASNAAWSGKQQQYYNVKDQFGQKINRQLGISDGEQYLTAYEEGAPVTKAESIETAKTYEVVEKDGIKYRKQPDGTFVQINE